MGESDERFRDFGPRVLIPKPYKPFTVGFGLKLRGLLGGRVWECWILGFRVSGVRVRVHGCGIRGTVRFCLSFEAGFTCYPQP